MKTIRCITIFLSMWMISCSHLSPKVSVSKTNFDTRTPSNSGVDVFFLGDSQFAGGHGQQVGGHQTGLMDFISNFKSNCSDRPNFAALGYDSLRFSGYGISGSGLADWLGKTGDRTKRTEACGISVRTPYGEFVNYPNANLKAQEGPMCQSGKSPLDVILTQKPRVIVANFMGTLGGLNLDRMQKAFDKFTGSLTNGEACIIMTSPPTLGFESLPFAEQQYAAIKYGDTMAGMQGRSNQRRARRQEIARYMQCAVSNQGSCAQYRQAVPFGQHRCYFVHGFDAETISAIGSVASYYPPQQVGTDPAGNAIMGRDRFHVNKEGSRAFFALESKRVNMCDALIWTLKNARAR